MRATVGERCQLKCWSVKRRCGGLFAGTGSTPPPATCTSSSMPSLFDTSGRPFSTTTLLRSGFFWPPETAHPFGPNSCTRSAGQLAARPAAHHTYIEGVR
jgi:hypothetical protein